MGVVRPACMRAAKCWLSVAALVCALVASVPSAPRAAPASDDGAGGPMELRISAPAFRGLEPDLRLAYSPGGNGWAGAGWSLSGLPDIQRVGPGKGAPTYTDSDTFLLEGLELRPCAPESRSPGCQHPSADGGTARRYAAAMERFQRIERQPGASGGHWTVWSTDGVKRTYRPRLAVGWRGPADQPYSWHLAGVEDTLGNRVSYQYAADGDARGVGQEYLRRIEYNGTVVGFETEDRPDVLTEASGKELVVTRKRLARIDVRTGGELVRAYALEYQPSEPGSPRPSVLRSVRQYGKDAQLEPGGKVSGGTALAPITLSTHAPGDGAVGAFTTDDEKAGLWGPPWPDNRFGQRNWDNESSSPLYSRFTGVYGQHWLPGDVDGDGRTDFIGTTSERFNPGDDTQPYQLFLHTALPNQDGSRLLSEQGTGRFNYRYADQETGIQWYNSDPPRPLYAHARR